MATILILGIGNSIRRDDGVGPFVAQRFAGRPGIEIISAVQLLPEHIESVAMAETAIIIDAAVDIPPGAVTCQRLVPPAGTLPTFDLHELRPAQLVVAAEGLYGRCAKVWLVAIGAADLALGEGLSPEVLTAVDLAADAVETVLQQRARPSGSEGLADR